MIEKNQIKNGLKVRVLGKSFGVSLNKAGLNIGDILEIRMMQSKLEPGEEVSEFISAHGENDNNLHNFLPEDLEIIKQ